MNENDYPSLQQQHTTSTSVPPNWTPSGPDPAVKGMFYDLSPLNIALAIMIILLNTIYYRLNKTG